MEIHFYRQPTEANISARDEETQPQQQEKILAAQTTGSWTFTLLVFRTQILSVLLIVTDPKKHGMVSAWVFSETSGRARLMEKPVGQSPQPRDSQEIDRSLILAATRKQVASLEV